MRLLFEMDAKDHAGCTRTYRRDSARAVIIEGGRAAMVHSLKYDYYKFPGGGILPGESPVDAMVRETGEEAGLAVDRASVKEYGLVRRVRKSAYDPDERFEQDNLYYLCSACGETPRDLDEYEAEERFTLEYVDPAEAIRVDRRDGLLPSARTMAEREARVLELLMNEGLFSK